MTTNAGLQAAGLTSEQMKLFWDFLSVVQAMQKAGINPTATWTINNVTTAMQSLP